jgi:hypothetical protein
VPKQVVRDQNASEQNSSLLARMEGNWNVLIQAATWLTSLIAGFLLPPPVGSIEGDAGSLFRFAQFVVTVFVGLLVVPMLTWRRKVDTNRWWAVSLLTLVGGIAAFFSYRWLTASWTATYDDSLVVVGSVLTEDGQYCRKEHPNASNDQMLKYLPGGPERVWTKASIDRNINILSLIYVLCMPVLTASVMSVTQAIYCASRPR